MEKRNYIRCELIKEIFTTENEIDVRLVIKWLDKKNLNDLRFFSSISLPAFVGMDMIACEIRSYVSDKLRS